MKDWIEENISKNFWMNFYPPFYLYQTYRLAQINENENDTFWEKNFLVLKIFLCCAKIEENDNLSNDLMDIWKWCGPYMDIISIFVMYSHLYLFFPQKTAIKMLLLVIATNIQLPKNRLYLGWKII